MRWQVVGATTVACVAGTVVALVLTTSASPRPTPSRFNITKLSGSLFTEGRWSAGPLYWVRLRATVCDPSPSKGGTYPTEIRITHFAVIKSTNDWWPARIVIDHAPWLVPLGETWGGKACGPVILEDPIPLDHYGVESLGNPLACYGVGLTIKAAGKQASKRAIVTCKPRL
jgi:hypothetical protein